MQPVSRSPTQAAAAVAAGSTVVHASASKPSTLPSSSAQPQSTHCPATLQRLGSPILLQYASQRVKTGPCTYPILSNVPRDGICLAFRLVFGELL